MFIRTFFLILRKKFDLICVRIIYVTLCMCKWQVMLYDFIFICLYLENTIYSFLKKDRCIM